MASEVFFDLLVIVSDLKPELARVKKDLSIVPEENRRMKVVTENLCDDESQQWCGSMQ